MPDVLVSDLATATPTSSSTVVGETGGVVKRFAFSFTQSGAGATARTFEDKLREVASLPDRSGVDSTGVADSAGGINEATVARLVNLAPTGTYKIGSTITLSDSRRICGDGELGTVIQNAGSGKAVQTTVSTPGGPKSVWHGLINLQINGTNTTTPNAAAYTIQQSGFSYVEKCVLQNHATALEMQGAVGTSLRDVSLQQATNGLSGGGINALDAVTLTNMDGGRITTTTNAIKIVGINKGLHFNGVDIESNTNFYAESGGNAEAMVLRNCWLEGNTTYNLATAKFPVFDTTYWAGDITVSGGYAPRLLNNYVTGTTNFLVLKVTSEVAEVSASGASWASTHLGQHGMTFCMPTIGAASTPVDHMRSQASVQSEQVASLAGTLFGFCPKPLANLNTSKVSQTAYVAGNYWPFGSAVVTTGQADMFGGAGAVKLSGSALHGSTAITVTANRWCVMQVAFSMVAAGETFGLWMTTTDDSGTMDKRLSYVVPDTNVRVAHVLCKPDVTLVRPNLILPNSGVIIHRLCVFQGAELMPLIREGASIPVPFMLQFQNIVAYASAAPVSGTWAVGDIVYNTAPAAAGTIGWVCTTAGAPGTWKTFGAIAA